jgi:uncharacterized protein (DUF2384 family)
MAVQARLNVEQISSSEKVLADLNARLATAKRVPSEVWRTLRDVARALMATSPEALDYVDPYLVIALQQGELASFLAAEAKDPVAQRRELRIGIEQMRQALREILEGMPVREDRPAKEIARWLSGALGVSQASLAGVIGTSPRTFQRWISETDPTEPEGPEGQRLRIIARIANQLRHVLTGPGVVSWLKRPHEELRGRAPVDLINDPGAVPKLEHLAARARSSAAT